MASSTDSPKPAELRNQGRKPKPDPNVNTPHPEDWAAWCEHPCTRFVANAMEVAAEMQLSEWVRKSWQKREADPMVLIELQTRADAYRAFLETGLNDYAAILEA